MHKRTSSLLLVAILFLHAEAAFAYLPSQLPATENYEFNPTIPTHQVIFEPSTEPKSTSVSKVTRAEFIKAIISDLYGNRIPSQCFLQLSPSNYHLLFKDVPRDADYALELCAAMVMGLVQGYPDATFKPDRAINFAEASKVLAKAYGLSTDNADPSVVWYVPYVDALRSHDALPSSANISHPITVQSMQWMISKLGQ